MEREGCPPARREPLPLGIDKLEAAAKTRKSTLPRPTRNRNRGSAVRVRYNIETADFAIVRLRRPVIAMAQ
jgi:hypothetical protein